MAAFVGRGEGVKVQVELRGGHPPLLLTDVKERNIFTWN